VEVAEVLVLRNMSIKGGFVNEMNVDGKFSLFSVGTKRFTE
jgi:hypothetical protein